MTDSPAPLIDPEKHRVIDISYTVEPGENPDRPFAIQRNYLADNSYRYDIERTHSHVGTHVEAPKHFYGEPGDSPNTVTVEDAEDNRAITDYPLDTFYGPAVLLRAEDPDITAEYCEAAIGDTIREGDIVVVRNDTETAGPVEDVYSSGGAEAPAFTEDAARWLADRDIAMLVIGGIRLGADVETGNVVHDVLMSRGTVITEIVDNLHAIRKDRFTLMALPYKVEGLDSSFTRAIVIEER